MDNAARKRHAELTMLDIWIRELHDVRHPLLSRMRSAPNVISMLRLFAVDAEIDRLEMREARAMANAGKDGR